AFQSGRQGRFCMGAGGGNQEWFTLAVVLGTGDPEKYAQGSRGTQVPELGHFGRLYQSGWRTGWLGPGTAGYALLHLQEPEIPEGRQGLCEADTEVDQYDHAEEADEQAG